MRRLRGFTLVELMVVVSIIILLVTLLLPALDNAQKTAAMAVCGSNLKQLGHGHLAYAASNRTKYPPFRQAITMGWNGEVSIADLPDDTIEDSLLWDYIQNADVLMCPIFQSLTNENAVRSYSLNWNCGSTPAGSDLNNEGIASITQVRRPANFAVFSEENPWTHPAYAGAGLNDADLIVDGWPGRDTLGTFHLPKVDRYAVGFPAGYVPTHHDDLLNTGVANVNFADGHVEMKDTLQTESVVYNDPSRITHPENLNR